MQFRFNRAFGYPPMFDYKSPYVQVLEEKTEAALQHGWDCICGRVGPKARLDFSLLNGLPKILKEYVPEDKGSDNVSSEEG